MLQEGVPEGLFDYLIDSIAIVLTLANLTEKEEETLRECQRKIVELLEERNS